MPPLPIEFASRIVLIRIDYLTCFAYNREIRSSCAFVRGLKQDIAIDRDSLSNPMNLKTALAMVLMTLVVVNPAAIAGHKKPPRRSKANATPVATATRTDSDTKTPAGARGQNEAKSPRVSLSSAWLSMVSRTQAAQPHWITPLVTVTPRLEQEFRCDFSWQDKSGTTTGLYGGGKGVELIPRDKLEVILGIPSYNVRYSASGKRGFADETLLVKYRLFVSNERGSNQILTFFLGASLPTGSANFSVKHGVITPTIAYGKGYGRFDFRSTLGIGLPTSGTAQLGRPMVWNSAVQEHVTRFLWPELEFNATFRHGGPNDGKEQLFVTPGLLVGRIPLHNRLGLTLGVGFQIAATRFHTYDHAVIISLRLPF